MATSLYIHVPFCLKKCSYCDFYSLRADRAAIDSYGGLLLKELTMRREMLGPLETIYFGGGTPTLLPVGAIENLLSWMKDQCGITGTCETTVEANPGTVSGELLRNLRKAGINRLSVGVQAFDTRDLKTLGRIHSVEEAVVTLNEGRKNGFGNIGIDLIYGIPGQDETRWRNTLGRALEFRPEHIATYELTPEKGTPLHEDLEQGRLELPDEDSVYGMYYTAIDLLEKEGYRHYEISNFALPGFECRHNLGYWDRRDYLGIGAAAHSFVSGRRWSNVCDLAAYAEAIATGGSAVTGEQELLPRDVVVESLFLGLRKREGIVLQSLPVDVQSLLAGALASPDLANLAEIGGGRLRLTRRGLILANEVIVRLWSYIERLLPA